MSHRSISSEARTMREQFPSHPDHSWYDSNERTDLKHMPHFDRIRGAPGFGLEIGGCACLITYRLRRMGWGMVCSDIFSTNCHPMLAIQVFPKEAIPYPDATFDLVICSNVLHHGDLARTCAEVARVLKAGGEFISLQEPAIAEDVDEAEYLAKHCAEALALGIDEHRPSVSDYVRCLSPLFQTRLIYCESNDAIPANYASEVSGGLTIFAKKR